ncbi:MAG TPA: formate hydrogenlyase transcriptional activator FlhA, partial [Leclercia adecarboxylata]|nr:formate hydrogenlyase transcriptional activator FlhA [Leclercia adecarboxylata]
MSYTPTNDPLDQGLFDITRTLLQQPDLCALARSLAWHARQMNLADRANILLWQSEQRRVYLYSTDEQDRDIRYEDEPLLANGPFRRMLSR